MTNLRFFKLLLFTIVIAAILSEGINFLLNDPAGRFFGVASIAFFAIFCQVFFILAQKAKRSKDPYSFIRLSIINVMAKIILVFVFVGVYYKFSGLTPHRLFLFPFLSSYLIFLCFETYFMFVLGDKSSAKS